MTTKNRVRISNTLESLTKAQEALLEARSLLYPTPYCVEVGMIKAVSDMVTEIHGALLERHSEEEEEARQ
jgi:hypothetical protein